MDKGAVLNGTTGGSALALVAGGRWTAVHGGELEERLSLWLEDCAGLETVSIDMGAVTEFDTYGAWLLERLRRELSARGLELEIENLSPHGLDLLAAMEPLNRSDTSLQPATGSRSSVSRMSRSFRGGLASVGRALAGIGDDLRSFANMLGTLTLAFGRLVLNPRRFRLTSAVHQLDRVGWKAVPIILLITFLIGAIIAQQGFFHFRKFGADIYVVDMVGILVLRELGVLLVAIMVAGRSGSAFTAELGSMKMREEIDALKTMGFDPVEILILPRILVLIIALPLLTFLGSLAALYGGGLVAWLYGGMDPEIYVTRLKEAINMTHFKVGLIKAPFMGAVIGIIACMEGLKVRGSAASLGQQTTRSVVKAIFMVIVLDGIFAVFFAAIGM